MVLKTCQLAGVVLAVLVVGLTSLSGVEVEIVNLSPTVMQNVTVDVTGASYSIGDIPAGSSSSVKVEPRGESSILIKHSDNAGEQHTLFIDTYIEGGYSGKITAHVKNIKLTPIG